MACSSPISLGIPLGLLIHWFAAGGGTAGAPAGSGSLWPATLTSVLLGIASAFVALLLALPVAMLAVRYSGRLATTIERSVYLSFALPDLVAAIAIAYGASRLTGFLYGTVVLTVLAEAMLFVPFAVVALRSTLGLVEPALEESGRSLGLGPLRTVWRVTVPLARPGIAAAAVLVFAFVLGRSFDRSGSAPARTEHAGHGVLGRQRLGRVRRGGSVRGGADRPGARRDVRPDEPVRPRPRRRRGLTWASSSATESPLPTGAARCSRRSTSSSPTAR